MFAFCSKKRLARGRSAHPGAGPPDRQQRRRQCALVVGKLLEAAGYGYGFDAQKREYGDLIKLGIIDPTKVVPTALQDARRLLG